MPFVFEGEHGRVSSKMIPLLVNDIARSLALMRPNIGPANIDIVEVTQPFIVNEGNFSISPTSVNETNGHTMIVWKNISQYVGNNDSILSSNETFRVTFTLGSSRIGINLPVEVDGKSMVRYMNMDSGLRTADIPQAYVNVHSDGRNVSK